MKFEKFVHKGVKEDGTFKRELGAVKTKGSILIGRGKGCGLPECNCSPGFFLSVCLPRTKKGVVEGVLIKFDNEEELNKYLNE
jgi:hypothetical protein